jgi:hypothetical protein
MDNFLYVAEAKIKQEIYGFTNSVTPDTVKQQALLDNLRNFQKITPHITNEWIDSMQPYIDRLAACPHVRITSQPVFQSFDVRTLPDGSHEIHALSLCTTHRLISSFEAFVSEVEKGAFTRDGIPQYFFIFKLTEEVDGRKMVRYSPLTTIYPLLDGPKSLKT